MLLAASSPERRQTLVEAEPAAVGQVRLKHVTDGNGIGEPRTGRKDGGALDLACTVAEHHLDAGLGGLTE